MATRLVLAALAVLLSMAAPQIAAADDYDKNLLLLRKALREGNCAQAHDASQRLVQIDPDRAEAYLGLGDAAMCLSRHYDALVAWTRYQAHGGDEDLTDKIALARRHMATVDVTITTWEEALPEPFMSQAEFEPLVPTYEDARQLSCTLVGVGRDVQDALVDINDGLCTVSVPPGRASVIEVTARGHTVVNVPVNNPSPGTRLRAEAALVREASGDMLDGQWVCATSDYPADLGLEAGGELPLEETPVWVPAGTYTLQVSTPHGDPLETTAIEVVPGPTHLFDVTGPRRSDHRRMHGPVSIPVEEIDLRASLTSRVPGHEGETLSLTPGEPREIFTGVYEVVLERLDPGDTVEDDAWFEVFRGEQQISVHAGRTSNLLSGSLLEEHDESWVSEITLADVPRGSRVLYDGETTNLVADEERNSFIARARPGNHTLTVISNWRPAWERTVLAEPETRIDLTYDAEVLPRYYKARKMHRGAIIPLAAGGAALIASGALYALSIRSMGEAITVDASYHALDGGVADEDLYIQYDSDRYAWFEQATDERAAAGVFLGVGGVSLSVSGLIYLLAPKDPSRRILGSSTMRISP